MHSMTLMAENMPYVCGKAILAQASIAFAWWVRRIVIVVFFCIQVRRSCMPRKGWSTFRCRMVGHQSAVHVHILGSGR